MPVKEEERQVCSHWSVSGEARLEPPVSEKAIWALACPERGSTPIPCMVLKRIENPPKFSQPMRFANVNGRNTSHLVIIKNKPSWFF